MPKHILRVYCPDFKGDDFVVPEYQQSHMLNVLRMREGTKFLAFNELSGEWMCEVEKVTKKEIKCCTEYQTRKYVHTRQLALGICQIKPENMKMVIEKCTELGVTDFYLLTSSYTNYHSDVSRLNRIAIFASEQSERIDIPKVHGEVPLSEFINNLPKKYTWFSAVERDSEAKSLIDMTFCEGAAGFIVGAEGGFTDAERMLLSCNTMVIRLSDNILRSETAAITCIAFAGMLKN